MSYLILSIMSIELPDGTIGYSRGELKASDRL